jgi:hypothetical protein
MHVPRVKRPMLDRDGPIRSWASAVSSDRPRAAKDTPRASPGVPLDSEDPIVRGVVSGGRVVDEWIRQAQQTARLLGGTDSSASWADASGRMFRTASDVMAAWWSMFGVPQPNVGAGVVSPEPGAGSHESAWQARTPTQPMADDPRPTHPSQTERASHSSAGPRVRLEVASCRPIVVTVDLHRRGVTQFRVLDLRAEHGDAPRIRGTSLDTWDSEGLWLRVAVPDDQPPGAYHGVILDIALDCAVGTVTLKIPE